MREAEMADGTILEFPDETTDDVINRAARAYVQRGGVTERPAQPAIPDSTFGPPGASEGAADASEPSGLGREIGLGVRTGLRALAAPFTFVGDAVNSGVNLGIRGVNAGLQALHTPGLSEQVTGQSTAPQIPELGRMSDAVNGLIDATGLPTPETPGERIRGRVAQEVVSTAVPMGIGRQMARAGTAGVRAVGEALSARPWSQEGAAVGAGLGGGTAREVFPDSDAADAIGTVGGLLAGAGIPAAIERGGRVIQAVAAPFTRGGRERVVGEGIRNFSSEPGTVEQRLANGRREIVPGSERSTAEVANDGAVDPGLISLERGVRNMSPAPFAERDAQRNAARGQAMTMAPPRTQYAAGQEARAGLTAARDRTAAETSQLYRAIPDDAGTYRGRDLYNLVMPDLMRVYGRATQGMPAELAPIVQRLTNHADTLTYGDLRTMASEMGEVAGRAAANRQGTLADQAGRLQTAIEDFMGAPGGLTPQQQRAHNTAVAARRNQGAVYEEGAVGDATARNRYGRPEANAEDVPRRLLAGPSEVQQTEAAAGRNLQVLDALRGAFTETMQQRVATGSPGAAGDMMDSATKFRNFVGQHRDAIRYLFGPQGEQNLNRIAEDFTSRQMVDTVGRAAGSNTVENLSAAQLMSAAFGGLVNPRAIETSPLYRYTLGLAHRMAGTENVMRDMLTRAMLDPAYAQILVSRATPQSIRQAIAMLNPPSVGARVRDAAEGAVRPMVVPGAMATAPQDQPPR